MRSLPVWEAYWPLRGALLTLAEKALQILEVLVSSTARLGLGSSLLSAGMMWWAELLLQKAQQAQAQPWVVWLAQVLPWVTWLAHSWL